MKHNNQFKNRKQPELPENQTVWKSDNQGVKKETFIQTGRRGGVGQRGATGVERTRGKAVPGGPEQARLRLVEQVVPHLHVCKLRGTTGERDRRSNPGFQSQEESFKTSVCKNLWGLQQWEKLPVSQESSLERPTGS